MLSAKPNKTETPDFANPLFARKILAAFELLLAVGLLEFSIWTVNPQVRLVAGILSGCLIFRCFFGYGKRPEFAKNGRTFSWIAILSISILLGLKVGILFLLLDLWTPSLEFFSQRTAADWMMVKIPTVVLQQVLFQLVFIPTLLFLTGSRTKTVFMAALIFGIFHLPNPLLVLLTLLIGLFWFSQAIDRPRLVTLTFSHLILAVALATVAEEYVLDMRVGQICFQKWPDVIHGESDPQTLVVYPRPLTGKMESVTQEGTTVRFQGRVFDKLRRKAPFKVHLVLGRFDPDDSIGNSWTPVHIQSVKASDQSGLFELNLDSRDAAGDWEIRLFAQHSFGWSYPINGSARVQILPVDECGELVHLHPKQIHGNIGHIKLRKNRTDLIGWAFTRPDHNFIESLLVANQNQLVPASLERRQRKEIADYFEDEQLMDCGFVSKIPFLIQPETARVYVRNRNGNLERIPVELAAPTTQVANRKGQMKLHLQR